MAAPPPGAPRLVVIHAEETWLPSIRDGKFDFFVKLAGQAQHQGIPTELVAAGSRAGRLHLRGDNLHIMVGERPAYGPRILHAMPAYVWGFWYLDEVGVHWNSSLRFATFDPNRIDEGAATWFFNGVAGHMRRENVSKFPQAALSPAPLPPARAVVFCQEIEGYRNRCHYLTTDEMIRTAAGTAQGGRVYVKLHPAQGRSRRRAILATCAEYPGVTVSESSIHDLIAASDVVVTQNSAAGFEALMHRKPVVTCARSDFWHATLVARSTADLRDALLRGPETMAGFAFEKYLWWFLGERCLEPRKDDFAARAWARIREKCLF